MAVALLFALISILIAVLVIRTPQTVEEAEGDARSRGTPAMAGVEG